MCKCCVGQRSMVINSVTMAQATGRVLFPLSLPDLLFQGQDVCLSLPAPHACVALGGQRGPTVRFGNRMYT